MGKTIRTRAKVLKKSSEKKKARRGRPPKKREPIELDQREKMAAVCHFFSKGFCAGEIVEEMLIKYGPAGYLRREQPYEFFSEAASKGWIISRPPPDLEFRHKLLDHYKWIKRVEVVHTPAVEHVAALAASELLGIVQQLHEEKGKREIHIGFAGGLSMRYVAAAFAQLIAEPIDGLPETLVIHAMVAGFDPNHPSTDPNAFFTYYMNQPLREVNVRFVGLRSPAIMKTGQYRELMKQDEIHQAFLAAEKLDIIVTSGAEWDDAHSQLRVGMDKSEESLRILEEGGCVGDILWRPLGPSGPVETPTPYRAMTLFELSALPGFISRGGRVLLMLGPCGGCGRAKGKLLKTVLDQEQHLVTDLAVDTRTATTVVKGIVSTTEWETIERQRNRWLRRKKRAKANRKPSGSGKRGSRARRSVGSIADGHPTP